MSKIHEGIFMLSIEDGQYVINTGNFIANSEIRALKDKLNQAFENE